MTRHPSYGCTLAVDWSGGTSFIPIGQVRDISGPSISRDFVEVEPDHDLPEDNANYVMKFPGMANAGQLSFPLNLDPTMDMHSGQANGSGFLGNFETIYEGTALPQWRYQNTKMQGGTATWVFRAFVVDQGFEMGAVMGAMEADVTVEISGKPTLTVS